jgi:hypothetical protein
MSESICSSNMGVPHVTGVPATAPLACNACVMDVTFSGSMQRAARRSTRQNLAPTFRNDARKGQESLMCQTRAAFQ